MADYIPSEPRPRPRSLLSYESKRSRRSGSSGHKIDLTETSKDKRRLNTKADPSLAMNEAQPAAVAQEQASNLASISSIQWRDERGNIITDPDRTNPTRNRLERPLDTIRSFSAAEDRSWNDRRASRVPRPASHYAHSYGPNPARNSYYGNPNQSRPMTGYYGRNYGNRQDDRIEEYRSREPAFRPHSRVMRRGSNPMLSQQNFGNVYPSQADQPSSHDTLPTGGASSRADTMAYSTSPSSPDSSVDRFQVQHQERAADSSRAKQQAEGSYPRFSPNFSGSDAAWRDANAVPQSARMGHNGQYNMHAERPVQDRAAPVQRNVIKLDSNPNATLQHPTKPKRQSWIKRVFTKSS